MFLKRSFRWCATLTMLVAVFAASAAYSGPVAAAGDAAQETIENVYWTWANLDPTVVGSAKLVRNHSGITAVVTTSGLQPGHAFTLWAIIFNNPEACSGPCSVPDDLNAVAGGDFHYLTGHVIGADGTATFGGRLKVDDLSGSGLLEIGMPAGFALTAPFEAEVHLVVHSHGPAQPGQVLKEQISSFSGGCTTFLGNEVGVAQSPADIPVNVGECSSLQFSLHQAPAD
jgi:hypothetical protein